MYHSHHDEMTQRQLGMIGLIVVHPKDPRQPPPARDYAIMSACAAPQVLTSIKTCAPRTIATEGCPVPWRNKQCREVADASFAAANTNTQQVERKTQQ